MAIPSTRVYKGRVFVFNLASAPRCPQTNQAPQFESDRELEETSHGYSADSNCSLLISMEFLSSSERFGLMDPPGGVSRLTRPPAGNCSKEDNPHFVEFDQEQRSLAMPYPATGSNIFRGTINGTEERIHANNSRQIQRFASSHTASKPADKNQQRLDAVNNVKTGKRRLPQSKRLKHSDARLPEVTT